MITFTGGSAVVALVIGLLVLFAVVSFCVYVFVACWRFWWKLMGVIFLGKKF